MTAPLDDRSLPELHRAAQQGDLRAVVLLIDSGSPVDERDHYGMTPLHHATRAGHTDVASFLISRGAKVNAYSYFDGDPHEGTIGELGWSVLHYARQQRMAELLVAHGAVTDAYDHYKAMTPLHWAISRGDREMARYLIQSSANVDDQDRHGLTPLHHAARADNAALVALLLDAGANVNVRDYYGMSVRKRGILSLLHWAALLGAVDEAERLIVQGVDINATDKRGMTALHAAALRGHVTTVELLLGKGAEADAKDCENRSALDIAANAPVAKALVDARRAQGN
jgi:ankyrin repeat protein